MKGTMRINGVYPFFHKRGDFMKNKAEVLATFRHTHNELDMKVVNSIYDVAEQTYLDLAFPFNKEVTEIPKDTPRAYTWIYDCMNEIVERQGTSSLTHYSENGISMTWDRSGVSVGLLSRITPRVGVL